MSVSPKDGIVGGDGPVQPDGAGSPKESLPADYAKDNRRTLNRRWSENSVHDYAVVSREKLAAAREIATELRKDAVTMREDAAEVREKDALAREGIATAREQKILAGEQMSRDSDDQLLMLQEANAHLVVATLEAQKLAEQVQTSKDKLDHLAYHDVLTDLPNRILLQDRLSQAMELSRRQGTQIAVMFLDLDRFKYINDSLGHGVGDQLLQAVAQRLVASVRHSDTISRQGGDEFVVLLPKIEQPQDAALTAQKMLDTIAQPYRIGELDLHIGGSIGISIYPNDGRDVETLIKNADAAMYAVKESGRNNYKFFEETMNVRAILRQSTEASLRHALERNEFVLYYQPKINLPSGKMVGVEALIRWQHPERGLLLPAEFISIAEDSGLILPIGRWVLRQACLQARAWLRAGLPPITIAVNTSAIEFHAKDFLKNVDTTLEEAGVGARYLELELTESVLMRDAESTNSLLHALSDLGVKLAIDDFGTGFSSFGYLRRFPIDTLKIDKSFVEHMTSNADDATIVSAIIAMGKSLKLRVIAEGVETAAQHTFLLAEGCDEAQGNFLGRPMPAAELATFLQGSVTPSLL